MCSTEAGSRTQPNRGFVVGRKEAGQHAGSRTVSPGITGFSSKALGHMADYVPWITSRFGGPREKAMPSNSLGSLLSLTKIL